MSLGSLRVEPRNDILHNPIVGWFHMRSVTVQTHQTVRLVQCLQAVTVLLVNLSFLHSNHISLGPVPVLSEVRRYSWNHDVVPIVLDRDQEIQTGEPVFVLLVEVSLVVQVRQESAILKVVVEVLQGSEVASWRNGTLDFVCVHDVSRDGVNNRVEGWVLEFWDFGHSCDWSSGGDEASNVLSERARLDDIPGDDCALGAAEQQKSVFEVKLISTALQLAASPLC